MFKSFWGSPGGNLTLLTLAKSYFMYMHMYSSQPRSNSVCVRASMGDIKKLVIINKEMSEVSFRQYLPTEWSMRALHLLKIHTLKCAKYGSLKSILPKMPGIIFKVVLKFIFFLGFTQETKVFKRQEYTLERSHAPLTHTRIIGAKNRVFIISEPNKWLSLIEQSLALVSELTINPQVILSLLLSPGIDSHTRVRPRIGDQGAVERQHSPFRQHLRVGRKPHVLAQISSVFQNELILVHNIRKGHHVIRSEHHMIHLCEMRIDDNLQAVQDTGHGAAVFQPCEAW